MHKTSIAPFTTFVMLIGAALAGPAHAQIPPAAAAQPRPWLELSMGLAFSGHENVNRPPLCRERALPCLADRGPAHGAVLSVTGYPRESFGIVGEVNTYSRLYSALGAGGHRENVNYLFGGVRLATPRTV